MRVLTLTGPCSRELRLPPEDLPYEAFSFFRRREIELAGARVLAVRVSYGGGLG
jgi:glycine cleavage system aminomethyltransferase T